jgi:hypothetical protein
MVSVTSGRMSLEDGSGVPQSAQKREVSGLDKWHFGHLIVTADSYNQVWLKIIKEGVVSQLNLNLSLCANGVPKMTEKR